MEKLITAEEYIEIKKELPVKDKDVTEINKEGSVFGDHFLLTDVKYKKANYRAMTDCKVMELSQKDLLEFL